MSTLPNRIIVGWVLDDPQSRDLCNYYQIHSKWDFHYGLSNRLQDVLRTVCSKLFKTSSSELKDFWKSCFFSQIAAGASPWWSHAKSCVAKEVRLKESVAFLEMLCGSLQKVGDLLTPLSLVEILCIIWTFFVSNQRNTKASFIFNVPRVCECMYTSLRWRKCCRRLKRQIHKLRRYQAEVAPLHIRHALYLIHLFVCIIATSPKVAYSPTSLSLLTLCWVQTYSANSAKSHTIWLFMFVW